MYAPIVTSALFMGIIFYDLIVSASQKEILKHFLFGLVATSAMAFLTLRGAELAAWGLLLIPVLAVFISSIVAAYKTPTPVVTPAPLVIMPEPKPEKKDESTINTPIDTPYMKTYCMDIEQPPCPSDVKPLPKCGFSSSGEIVAPEGACPKPEPEPSPSPSCPPPEQPKQAADLVTAVTSKLTPAISCPSAGTA
jgi:hypothetical protein